MKIKLIKKIMRILLFSGIAFTNNIQSDLSIELSVYDGRGGLLIDWHFDEEIIIETVKISSKKFGDGFIIVSPPRSKLSLYISLSSSIISIDLSTSWLW